MNLSKKYLLTFLATLLVAQSALAGIDGHSGIVFHVNKYGHYSGHSTHYDYRFYPEKSLLDHLIDHHHMIREPHNIISEPHNIISEPHHIPDDVGYGMVDDHGYHGNHDPFYFYLHDDEHHFH